MKLLSLLPLLLSIACSNEPPTPDEVRSTHHIQVKADGYHPSRVHAPAGKLVRLIVERTAEGECGSKISFPELKMTHDLPLGKPITLDVPMPSSGELSFSCGMGMLKGTIVAH